MWRRLTTRKIWRVSREGDSLGYEYVSKRHGLTVASVDWFLDSGLKSSELRRNVLTGWERDGTVVCQYVFGSPYCLGIQFGLAHQAKFRGSPPWLGRQRDQEAPTAPWLAQGMTPEEWWRRVCPGRGKTLEETRLERTRKYEECQAAIAALAQVKSAGRFEQFHRAQFAGETDTMLRLLGEVGYSALPGKAIVETLQKGLLID